ncbi:isochorismate synthase [Polaribacter sp.]|uniref:isochorismate synthase n=1 Tax=Polaribacter sp. TaxID=1920175 RepID=UPI003EF30F74
MSIILDKIQDYFNKNTPFVVCRKPNATTITGFFMQDDDLVYTTDFTESGFVFAPFNSEENAILFPKENATFLTEELNFKDNFSLKEDFKETEISKETYTQLVAKTIEIIAKNELQKVVVSRKEIVKIEAYNLLTIYKKLLETYANAFVYIWFHPKVGLWLGATPETLLNIDGKEFTTMSLAGTQLFKNDKNVVWKTKELEEQQLVTNFIESQLKDITTDLKIDKKETVKAGNLLHLRTKVSGKIDQKKSTLKTLISALHPTPAVCGLPREKAKEFILKNENYNRNFYTGFLGELNLQNAEFENESSNLYVNLRCMEIKSLEASLYIGGGITKSSNPGKEWQETVSKSKTMKRVL